MDKLKFSLVLLLSLLSIGGTSGLLPCEKEDLIELDYFPNLERESHFTSTRISDLKESGIIHCKKNSFDACLDWCAYDTGCVSVHFMITDTKCVCHFCKLMREQLPNPLPVRFAEPCDALGFKARFCTSLGCRQKMQTRMVARYGNVYEEIPLLDARVWMSSVKESNFSEFGPHRAVDDALNTFAEHSGDAKLIDDGFHWIIIELPFLTRITHVTVRSGDLLDYQSGNVKEESNITGIYLLDWDIRAVNDEMDCKNWTQKDNGILGAYTLVIGKHKSSQKICVYGQNTDQTLWRAATGVKKLKVRVIDEICQLEANLKLWKVFTECKVYVVGDTYYGNRTQNLQGAELLVASDIPHPEALFAEYFGVYYKEQQGGVESRKFHKLISWKYWTKCGHFSYLLTLSHSKPTVIVSPNCRNLLSQYIAIRTMGKPLSIADVQVYQTVSQIDTSQTYRAFTCPASQYSGFTPDFIGAYVRPDVLYTDEIGDIDMALRSYVDIMSLNPCYRTPESLKHTKDGIDMKCSFQKSFLQSKRDGLDTILNKFRANFARPAMDTGSPNYVINELYGFASRFFRNVMNGQTKINDQYKRMWIKSLLNWFDPEDSFVASHLHSFRRDMHTKYVLNESKLRSDIYVNSAICFVSCHWAQKFVNPANKSSAATNMSVADVTVGGLLKLFLEAFCPNPCIGSKCNIIKNIDEGMCEVTALWQNAYKCVCQPGHSLLRGACVPKNPCLLNPESDEYPCNHKNTLYCQTRLWGRNITETECVCLEGFSGPRCDRKGYKPCEDLHREHRVTGYFACGEPSKMKINLP